jgi:hypothetical protein
MSRHKLFLHLHVPGAGQNPPVHGLYYENGEEVLPFAKKVDFLQLQFCVARMPSRDDALDRAFPIFLFWSCVGSAVCVTLITSSRDLKG